MKLSPFTPIHFNTGKSSGLSSRYMQTWATTDHIMVQVVISADESAPTATLDMKVAGIGWAHYSITWQVWQMNTNKKIFFTILQNLAEGFYTFTLAGVVSEPWCVTADAAKLAKTTLIQYRFKDNKQREDVVSVIDYVPYFFDFRVHGGFKDSNVTFGVSNEQFTTQNEDVVELYAHEYVIKGFTMGSAIGVPVWCGELLNLLLTCSYVYFDGKRFVRNDSETPQPNILVEGLDSFVYTQNLREIKLLEAEMEEINQTALRRSGDNFRSTDDDTNRITL